MTNDYRAKVQREYEERARRYWGAAIDLGLVALAVWWLIEQLV